MKMKKKLMWFLAIAAFAALWYMPEKVLYRENIWSFERIPGLHISPAEAERQVAELGQRINRLEQGTVLDPVEVYRVQEALRKLPLGLDLPASYVIPGTHIIGYADEAEVPHRSYWDVYNLDTEIALLKQKKGWSGEQEAIFKRLQSGPEVATLWHPKLVRYAKTRYLESLLQPRMLAVGFALAWLLFWQCARVNWLLRRMFNRQTLQLAGCILSCAVTLGTCPALAQQLFSKLKKRSQAAAEEIVKPTHGASSPAEPVKFNSILVEAYGDFTHDRQQLVTFTCQLTPRFSLVLFNQNRQSATAPGALSYFGFGAKVRVAKSFSITAHTGPQFEFTTGGRLEQQTAFLNFAWRSPRVSVTLVNRFSRGLVENIAPAHRHIAAIRAGPMPKWLEARGEFRQVGSGKWVESFWGPMFSYGKFLPKRVRPVLSGLYAWPHFDFIKRSWDVRLGYAWSATF